MKQTNLDATEKRLRKQYARLEATLAQFDSQRGAFEAMLNSLPTVTNTKK
jgi:flagellar capping protein FliD